MKKSLLALVLICSAWTSHAQVAFKGVVLGQPVLENQVETICGKKGLIPLGDAGKLLPSSKNPELLVCKGNVTYAGYDWSIDSGINKNDRALFGVTLTRSFLQGAMDVEPHAGSADLEAKMIAVYGQPTTVKTVTLQNGFGATRQINPLMVWEKGDITIVKFDQYQNYGRLGYGRDVVVSIASTSHIKAKLDSLNATKLADTKADM